MRFSLFSKISFEVHHPDALIEAYCFQGDFYKNYDLLLRKGDRSIWHVNKIGARIKKDVLSRCEAITESHKDLPIFRFDLDTFLNLDSKTRNGYIPELGEVIKELKDVNGIGFSKATKILHTLYPRIVPMIDNNLQEEYHKLKPQWKQGNWNQIFMDYYNNFLVEDTYDNLCKVHSSVSYLGLTKVRVFDILWWSYLKAESLKHEGGIHWTTIRGGE